MSNKMKFSKKIASFKSIFGAFSPHEEYNGDYILTEHSDFDTIETYKSIRTNILFSMPKAEGGKVVVVSSSSPGEGKSTTSVNLAVTFAQMGARVVLVDCDMRKARVHRYLKIDRGVGISNVLCGFVSLEEATRHNVRDNLDVITAGEIPPNPAELLETDEFANVIAELKTKYDYVFFDTPPMTLVTDAAIIMNKQKDIGAVLVTRVDVTTFDLLDISVDDVRRTSAKFLGVIMLGCPEKTKKYGYYRRYGGYRYGSKYGYNYRYGYNYNYSYGYGYGDRFDKSGDESDEKDDKNNKK